MRISLNLEHLRFYKDLAALLIKYRRAHVFRVGGLEGARGDGVPEPAPGIPEPEELPKDLETIGPLFVKIGQLLCTRPDIVDLRFIRALSRLEDKVAPFSYKQAQRIIARELGVRISKAFRELDPRPLAAASLGQVHRAWMRDGRPVAVKVQRPGIRKHLLERLEALIAITAFLDHHTKLGYRYRFHRMLEEFRKSILRELDYQQEAQNLVTIQRNLQNFDKLIVPSPVEDYTTSRVLTMDYVRGRKITTISPLARMEMKWAEPVEQLFEAYLQQIFVDGFFHADPHPGNVLLTDDGRIVLLDLGMVAWLTEDLRRKLLALILTISESSADDAATIILKIGQDEAQYDYRAFAERVAEIFATHRGVAPDELEMGYMVLELLQAAGDHGIHLPPQLTMFGKTLLNLGEIAGTLNPGFDPYPLIHRAAINILHTDLVKSLSPWTLYVRVLEGENVVNALARKMNLLQGLAQRTKREERDLAASKQTLASMQKIANRLALSLFSAAALISAAILMLAPTSFRIWRGSGALFLLCIAGAIGGFLLIKSVIWGGPKT